MEIPFEIDYESKFKVGQKYTQFGFYGGVTHYTVQKIDRERNRVFLAESWEDLDGNGTRPGKWHKLETVDGKERCLEWTSETYGDVWIYADTTRKGE